MSPAAPGPSGWTEEILEALCDDAECLKRMTHIIQDIRANVVHARARDALTSCRLIALHKNGKIRPIAITEAFLKVAASCAVDFVRDDVAEIFEDVQKGFRTSFGVPEVLTRAIEDAENGKAVATLDATNAFNSISRNQIARELFGHTKLSPLWALFDLAYRQPSELIYRGKDSRIRVIHSTEGARQGDVLGLLFFCLAIHPALRRAKENFPEVRIHAIVDDITLSAERTSQVAACARFIKDQFRAIGLKLNSKSTILIQDGSDPTTLDIGWMSVTTNGFTTLGGLVTPNKEERTAFVRDQAEKHNDLWRRLPMMASQDAMGIIRQSMAHRMTFLLQTNEPEITLPGARTFDTHMMSAVGTIISAASDYPISAASRETQILLHLQPRDGGVGVPRAEWTRTYLYEYTKKAIKMKAEGKRLSQEFNSGSYELADDLKAELDSFGVVQGKHRSTASNKTSLLWMVQTQEHIPNREFGAALCFRIAHPLTALPDKAMCPGCRDIMAARCLQEHLVGCATLKDINATTTHTAVKVALEAIARTAHVNFHDEPKYEEIAQVDYKGKQKGPDITFFLPSPLTVDVKGVNAASVANAPFTISKIVERKKAHAESLYLQAATDRGERFEIVAFDTLSGLQPGMKKLISELVGEAPQVLQVATEQARISTTIARAVGRILLRHKRRVRC